MSPNLSRRALVAGLGLSLLPPALGSARPEGRAPILDAHVHLLRSLNPDARRGLDLYSATQVALRAMDAFGIEQVIVSPPPFTGGHPLYGLAEIKEAIRGQARFAFTSGGESLNPLLQDTPADRVSDAVLKRFADAAEEIAAAGAAGFGELAAEHFSSGFGRHPYESSPPDHPLLLALADIAAKHAMPIELHMEAVPQDMPFPPMRAQGPHPGMLHANIAPLERLLDHNPRARIIWVHAGWDLTGERRVPLMRGLLERHANLAMSVKYDHTGAKATAPFPPDGDAIRPGWIAMLRAFPDRFVIGSDQFIEQGTGRLEGARRFVDALPPDLTQLVASENARRLYRLAPV